MLIAISTFVRESFNTNTATSGDNLDSIRVGELSVEIENGPTAQLVAIVRGSAEKQLRPLMQTALARMYEEQPGVMEALSRTGAVRATQTLSGIMSDIAGPRRMRTAVEVARDQAGHDRALRIAHPRSSPPHTLNSCT